MKRIIAFITVLVFAITTCAIVSFSEGDYKYSLDATIKQINQGSTATLRLELTKNGSSFDYCGVNATISVPFDISDVTYTVPGKTAVPVTAEKLLPEEETSGSNPYTFTIDYSPEFSVESGASETASGNISISFKIGDEAKTGYKDIAVTDITVFIDETVEDVSSEETPSEDVSSEETPSEDVSSEDVSSEETSIEETPSEDVTSETSQEETLEVYNAGHSKKNVEITPKNANNTNGDGPKLTIKVLDKNAQNAKLSDLRVGILAEPTEEEEGIVFEKEYPLSPAFSSDTASYSVTVDADVTVLDLVYETVFSGADVSFEASAGASISNGVITLGSSTTCRITITINSEQRKQKYYLNINKGESSEIPSDPSSDVSSDPSTDVSSEAGGTVSNPEDISSDADTSDVSSDDDVIANVDGDGNGIGTGFIILIIIISFICGFVLCLILVKTGAIPMKGPDKKKQVQKIENDDFISGGAAGGMDSGYTATRVMPIPGGNNGKKFEVDIEYDEPATEKTEITEKKEETETKKKKQSFFFDDDEF